MGSREAEKILPQGNFPDLNLVTWGQPNFAAMWAGKAISKEREIKCREKPAKGYSESSTTL